MGCKLRGVKLKACRGTSDKCCGGIATCKGCSFCVSVTAAAAKDKRDISGAAAAARELFERGQRFWAEQRGRPAKSATCDSWCKIECSTTGDKCCGGIAACKGCSFCGSVTAAAARDSEGISGATCSTMSECI